MGKRGSPIGGSGGGGSGGVVIPQSASLDLRGLVEMAAREGLRIVTHVDQGRLEIFIGFDDGAGGDASTWGDVIYRGETDWKRLPAGSNGQVLKSGGPSADLFWGAGGSGGGAFQMFLDFGTAERVYSN